MFIFINFIYTINFNCLLYFVLLFVLIHLVSSVELFVNDLESSSDQNQIRKIPLKKNTFFFFVVQNRVPHEPSRAEPSFGQARARLDSKKESSTRAEFLNSK